MKAHPRRGAEQPSERETRVARLRGSLARGRQTAFLVSAQANIRYLTGFTGSSGYLLVTREDLILYTDGRYTTQAREQTSGVEIVIAPRNPLQVLSEDLRKRRIHQLAFEQTRLPFDAYQYLTGSSRRLRLEPAAGLVEELRMVKSPEEIERLRRAAALNAKALDLACRRVGRGWTEVRLAAEIEFQMRRLGAEKAAFDTIVASGPRSALPHAAPAPVRLARNALIVMDQGAILDGYTSDMTRMACLGRLSRREQQLLAAVAEAQMAAVDAVKAGVKAKTVDRAARQVLKRFHLEDRFTHSTGHGLGLEIHESPRIGPEEDRRLVSGMVVTIEPGVYIEGLGGVRIEDAAAVTASGCDILTPTSRQLRSL